LAERHNSAIEIKSNAMTIDPENQKKSVWEYFDARISLAGKIRYTIPSSIRSKTP